MNKLVYVTLVGLLFCAPAFANTWGDKEERGAYQCRQDDMQDGRHCHPYHHNRHMLRGDQHDAAYMQSGQDLNSNRWAEGAPRATLSPHNARGNERPSVDPNSGYWVQW